MFLGDQNDKSSSGFDLADIGHGFGEDMLLGGDGDDRNAGGDKGDGSVFQFSGGIGLCMDIGDLF